MLDIEIFLGRFWSKSSRIFAKYVLHQVAKYNAKKKKFCESGPSKLLLGRQPQVSQNPSRFNRNLPNYSKHSQHMWIQIDEMDKIDKKSQVKDPRSRQFNQSCEIFQRQNTITRNLCTKLECRCRQCYSLSWNRLRRFRQNNSENCLTIWLSIVRPTWNMFTLHHKDAVSVKIIWASMGQEKDIKATTKWSSEHSKQFNNRWSELRQMKPVSQKIDITDVPTGGFTSSQTRQ